MSARDKHVERNIRRIRLVAGEREKWLVPHKARLFGVNTRYYTSEKHAK